MKVGSTAGTSFSDTGLQNGRDYSYVVIPKSVTESRIRENYAALDVSLDETDVQAINGLDNSAEGAGRIGPDPAVSDFA